VTSADQLACLCNSARAYYDPENNVCFECPVGLFLNAGKSACVCAEGYTLKGSACAPLCSDQEVYNPKTKACDCKIGLVRNQAGVCACPSGFVSVNEACVRNCQDPEIFDVLTGNCVCKFGFVRGTNNLCVSRCPPG
jgi:hypothetical protein